MILPGLIGFLGGALSAVNALLSGLLGFPIPLFPVATSLGGSTSTSTSAGAGATSALITAGHHILAHAHLLSHIIH
jgi:hypothetical protein